MSFLKNFFFRIFSFFGIGNRSYSTIKIQGTLPSKLEKNTIYIVEDDSYREQVAMLCPCGCRRVLHMNLLSDERPCWKVTEHNDGSISLHPSVWRKTDCCSHFWFKNGKVKWVRKFEAPVSDEMFS